MNPLQLDNKEMEVIKSTIIDDENNSKKNNDKQEDDLDYEDINFIQDICLLNDHGISDNDIELLRKMGINTIKGFQMIPRKTLLSSKSFNDEKIDAIQAACTKALAKSDIFITALEVSDQRKQIFKISTGSKNLDDLLDGGIESMSITEVFGEFRTGKTQLAHTLCVTTQIPNSDYPGGKVLFIDTENTFRPERIKQIARRFNLDQTAVLKNILYARVYTSDRQYEILKTVAETFHKEFGVFKLLIIDSIVALFRSDFSGRSELAERQQKLGQTLSFLQKISEEFNIAVYLTNQVTSVMKFSMLDMELYKPSGGNIMAHASTTRLSFKKGPGNTRFAILYDSPELEEKEVIFIIAKGGITDPNNS